MPIELECLAHDRASSEKKMTVTLAYTSDVSAEPKSAPRVSRSMSTPYRAQADVT
jgi:hypothetical protein